MSEPRDTVCFTCGQPTGGFPRLNCLPGGQACPTCRDRLLESLPPCLPFEGEESEAAGEATPLTLLEGEPEGAEEPDEGAPQGRKGPREVLHGQGPDQPA